MRKSRIVKFLSDDIRELRVTTQKPSATTLKNLRSNAVFYCVADARYFLGLVALLNSLRLHGHPEPVYVLDRGLTGSQREHLAPHVELVEANDDVHPILSK